MSLNPGKGNIFVELWFPLVVSNGTSAHPLNSTLYIRYT